MLNTINKLAEYLHTALDIAVTPQKWAGAGTLPYYLAEIYDFYIITILGNPVIVMGQISGEAQTPASVRKHHEVVSKNSKVAVLYLCDTITPYNRKRLIQHKVPFVIPGSQLYLPDLGIDLREHLRQARQSRVVFSPSTQVLIIYSIINRDHGPFTPAGTAVKLNYTSMTMSRAFDELEMSGIGKVKTGGRERHLSLPSDPRELWSLALPFIKSPLLKTLYVRSLKNKSSSDKMYPAGLSALSMYSMINGPGHQVMAIGNDSWNNIKKSGEYVIVPIAEPGVIELQVWRYSPGLLSSGGSVDILSLYLTLIDETDERVQKALNEMMAGYKW